MRKFENSMAPIREQDRFKTGFEDLDNTTLGFTKSQLIIVASRPSMGKTSFALSMIRNMALDYNYSVGILSLNMNFQQITNRLISFETGIGLSRINTKDLTPSEMKELPHEIKRLERADIYIENAEVMLLKDLGACCKAFVDRGVGVVFIDWIQLITIDQPVFDAGIIERELKRIARKYDVVIVALNQLDRSCVDRCGYEGKRPLLTDLSDSDGIENVADVIVLLHRPELYGFRQTEGYAEELCSTKGIVELDIAKNRNGITKTTWLKIDESTTYISKYEKSDSPAPF